MIIRLDSPDLNIPGKGHRARQYQHGAVLLFSLIALVAMSIAALALIKNVDTATLIAGNLAFRQSTTATAEAGIQQGVTLLANMQAGASGSVFNDTNHVFNKTGTGATIGYYPNIDPALNLAAAATWADANTTAEAVDASGNRYRAIIQRMCRPPDPDLPAPGNSLVLSTVNCLFAGNAEGGDSMKNPLPAEICNTAGCSNSTEVPLYRITVRVEGPKNTVSYVQANTY